MINNRMKLLMGCVDSQELRRFIFGMLSQFGVSLHRKFQTHASIDSKFNGLLHSFMIERFGSLEQFIKADATLFGNMRFP